MLYILVRYLAESGGPDHQRLEQLAEYCQQTPAVLRLTLISLWEEPEDVVSGLCNPEGNEDGEPDCQCRKLPEPGTKEQRDDESPMSA